MRLCVPVSGAAVRWERARIVLRKLDAAGWRLPKSSKSLALTRYIEQASRASRYGLREIQRMDASKLTNGIRDEVLAKRSAPEPKSGQPNAVRPEAKKVGKRATGKKAKTERPQMKAIGKSKSEKLVFRYFV